MARRKETWREVFRTKGDGAQMRGLGVAHRSDGETDTSSIVARRVDLCTSVQARRGNVVVDTNMYSGSTSWRTRHEDQKKGFHFVQLSSACLIPFRQNHCVQGWIPGRGMQTAYWRRCGLSVTAQDFQQPCVRSSWSMSCHSHVTCHGRRRTSLPLP